MAQPSRIAPLAGSRSRKVRSFAPGAAYQPLVNALRGMEAEGARGFEGFARDVLAEVTGQPFRLLKPGPQGGVDALQDPLGNGLIVGLEGKRYGEGTPLPLDELQHKLTDAVFSWPGLDLWLLFATREVSATDQRALHEQGDRLGVAVEIIDWSASPAALPALGVLAAAAPNAVHAHLGDRPGITACLGAIENHPGYKAELDRLVQRLMRSDVGYAAARRQLAEWLRASFSDQHTARANLGSDAEILDPTLRRVPRPSIARALADWWASPDRPPLALLGEEGVGKTWAALWWWHEKAGSQGLGLPLTIVLSARDVETTDPEKLLADVLAQRTGSLRNAAFWHRRLQLWKSDRCTDACPKIVLVIDGLNQRWEFLAWAELLQPLFAHDWRGQVAVLLTCRPDHWQHHPKSLVNLSPSVVTMPIGSFNDSELDELLSLHGLKQQAFDQSVLELMRVPRLSHVAIERRAALQESGDITRERLVYEDWKRRLRRYGARLVLGDVEFRDFVAGLGRSLRDSLASPNGGEAVMTRRQLVAELGRDSGAGMEKLEGVISEIVNGRWLEEVGRPNWFKLRKEHAPFALGLALVDDLWAEPAPSALPGRLAVFFDPLRGQDFGADILRAATTVAMLERDCPETVRRCLIEAWLSAQNFRVEDFQAFWKLIGAEPSLFLEVTREIWLHPERSVHRDEILIKALANAAERPATAKQLRRQAVEWLSGYWPDPDMGRFLNYDPNTPEAEERRKATAARRREWDAVAPTWGMELPIHCVKEGNASWFAHRAIGVLSFLPRVPFVPALIGWG